jgi:hypothetical protein
MKNTLIFFLLVVSLALAASMPASSVEATLIEEVTPVVCEGIVEQAKQEFNSTSYDDLLRLGQAYENAGQCFREAKVETEAKRHYSLAAQYYTSAASNMTVDVGVKASLYAAAGDSYFASQDPQALDDAKQSFQKVLDLATEYPGMVSVKDQTHAQETLAQMNQPESEVITPPSMPTSSIDFILVALLVIIILGFVAAVFYKR